jgi:drug/metabolite transporter (DMT)-like permease
MNTLRLKADLTLLVVALVWGSAFVVQRIAAVEVGIFLFNGLRFLVGALALLPLAWITARRQRRLPALQSQELAGVALLGVLLFTAAALQQWGLQYTTAGNAGFITGLYVVFVPIFLAFGWQRWPRPAVWPAALLAAVGLFLLSTEGHFALAFGDSLELAGAVIWAFHVILIGHLVQRMEVLYLAVGQYVVCGLLSLLVGAFSETGMLAGLAAGWWAILYTGLLSVGLGYTLQAIGQKVAPPADAAILLSAEAAFAALFGWLILQETLTPLQILGCLLIFSGMLLAQFSSLFSLPSPSSKNKPIS